MTGAVVTYTIIHVSSKELAPVPYAVVVADADGRRVAARADGDTSWLHVGAEVELADDERFGLRASAASPATAGVPAA
jgi:uncharacterized OB-fold protein